MMDFMSHITQYNTYHVHACHNNIMTICHCHDIMDNGSIEATVYIARWIIVMNRITHETNSEASSIRYDIAALFRGQTFYTNRWFGAFYMENFADRTFLT